MRSLMAMLTSLETLVRNVVLKVLDFTGENISSLKQTRLKKRDTFFQTLGILLIRLGTSTITLT